MRREAAGADPLGRSTRQLLLEVDLAVDAVRVALQGEGPLAQMRQERRRHLLVVGEEIALRDPVLGKEDALGARQTHRSHKRTVRPARLHRAKGVFDSCARQYLQAARKGKG